MLVHVMTCLTYVMTMTKLVSKIKDKILRKTQKKWIYMIIQRKSKNFWKYQNISERYSFSADSISLKEFDNIKKSQPISDSSGSYKIDTSNYQDSTPRLEIIQIIT